MFDDIVKDKEKYKDISEKSIIDSLKYNVEAKDKIIKKLVGDIVDLKRQVKDLGGEPIV